MNFTTKCARKRQTVAVMLGTNLIGIAYKLIDPVWCSLDSSIGKQKLDIFAVVRAITKTYCETIH